MKKNREMIQVGMADTGVAQSPGTFTATGNMMTPHTRHNATLLLNGKVLMAGGFQDNILADVPRPRPELYDPSTGTFTYLGRPSNEVTIAVQ